jgi:hypothetical protein
MHKNTFGLFCGIYPLGLGTVAQDIFLATWEAEIERIMVCVGNQKPQSDKVTVA